MGEEMTGAVAENPCRTVNEDCVNVTRASPISKTALDCAILAVIGEHSNVGFHPAALLQWA